MSFNGLSNHFILHCSLPNMTKGIIQYGPSCNSIGIFYIYSINFHDDLISTHGNP